MEDCANIIEDDGSVFREINGVKHQIRLGEQAVPCCGAEINLLHISKYGRNNTAQSIWLESDQRIKPKNVSRALFLVSRQVPHLQFCFMKEKNTFWFKRMEQLDIDFGTTIMDPLEMHYDMLKTSYDLYNGPLWKVRLNLHIKDAKRSNKKYSAFLTLGVHHAITDATTNMKICRDLISILNKMIVGEEIVPIYSPVCPNMDEVTEGIRSKSFVLKTVCTKLFQSVTTNFNNEASFNGALPFPKTKSVEPKVKFTDLSKCETETLLKLCRKAEVTVNTFILVAANFALMTVAQSRSKIPIGPKKIVAVQAINLRRYYEPQYKDTSGCQISYLEDESQMELSDFNQFWSLARQTHIRIKRKLEVSKEPIMNISMLPFAGEITKINSFLTSMGYSNRIVSHYFLTNMGNLTHLLPAPEKGDDIEITYILRGSANPYLGTPFEIAFHTFREKLLISMEYSDNTMEEQIAQEFFDSLLLHIRTLIKK